MEIVKPGTPIITKIGTVKALISGVCIREESVSYEISYFASGEHKNAWIYRYEFDIDSAIKTKPGFKSFSEDDNQESNYVLLE